MPKFSIIIPVYNSEVTLERCLNSLQRQSFNDFQVLMIENGSCDASLDICAKFSLADSRFLLIPLDANCGPSGARNAGLEHATGEITTFVDSDDFVGITYLQDLEVAFRTQNADVVFMGYYNTDTDGTIKGNRIPTVPETGNCFEILTALSMQDLFGYTWVKAFRSSVLAGERFPEDMNLFEDEVLACRVLPKCRIISVLEKPVYYYVTGNVSSLVGRTHSDYCQKCNVVYTAWCELLAPWEGKDTFLTAIANRFTERCRFYGFERPVPLKAYFTALSETDFFKKHAPMTSFDKAVSSHKFVSIRIKKIIYRFKVWISHILGR